MPDNSENNKRIAKNTIALYFRTFITMIVGLYTGRVMLQALGVDNYGINNVVGGIVAMSSLITATMSQAISRYITYALGKGDREQLKSMFSTAVNAQIVMSVIAVIVLEIFGLWFLNSGAQIPEGRETAALWVFQCSLICLVISLVSSSYNSLIIAHEKMSIYAYVSIADAIFKLAICYAIMAYDGDRLIFYAILHLGVVLTIQAFYALYCGKNFEEAKYSPRIFDKHLLKELTVFSGWNLLNNGAYTFATQGVNMLVNAFFGVAFNAARGLAIQVNTAVQSFVNNFTVAFSPQITKTYAAGETSYAVHLSNRGTKFAWLMMFVFIVPVCCEADTLLKLWLGEVPEWSALFLRFAMFESLASSSGSNLYRLIQADGRITKYTIHAAITAGVIFPLTWIFYIFGAPVWSAYLIFIVDFVVLNIVRIYDIKKLMTFSVSVFMKEAVYPCLIVSFLSFVLPLFICYIFEPSIFRFFINVPVAILWTFLCCITFGLSKSERQFFLDRLLMKLKKKK